MKFDSIWCALNPRGVFRPFPFGRCAQKSLFLGAAYGFRISKRSYAVCFQVRRALDVVAQCHHHHFKIGSLPPDRTNQTTTHL